MSSRKPADALRFLLTVDADLRVGIGREAIRYDDGIHVKHRLTRYHDFFVHRIKPGEKVLDVGCGNGAVAYDVAERAEGRVTGVDLSPNNISEAERRYYHPLLSFRIGDVLSDLAEESFDVVILSNVLEHLPDRSQFLRRLVRAASWPRILIRVPLFEREWKVPLLRELGLEWRLDKTHETEYTLESFSEEIAEAGLKVIHQEVRWGEIWAELEAV